MNGRKNEFYFSNGLRNTISFRLSNGNVRYFRFNSPPSRAGLRILRTCAAKQDPTHAHRILLWSQICLIVKVGKTAQSKQIETLPQKALHKIFFCMDPPSYRSWHLSFYPESRRPTLVFKLHVFLCRRNGSTENYVPFSTISSTTGFSFGWNRKESAS